MVKKLIRAASQKSVVPAEQRSRTAIPDPNHVFPCFLSEHSLFLRFKFPVLYSAGLSVFTQKGQQDQAVGAARGRL